MYLIIKKTFTKLEIITQKILIIIVIYNEEFDNEDYLSFILYNFFFKMLKNL